MCVVFLLSNLIEVICMSVVRVKDSHVLERQITGKTGPMTFREQRACLLMGGMNLYLI